MKEKKVSRTSTAKERRKRRKILLSVLMIVFTGVVLTLGTYAWFTANKTVTVNSIDVNVATSNGLQVSTDAITWKTVISNDDITGAKTTYSGAINQLPTDTNSLSPVSSVGEIGNGGLMKMFSGEIGSDSEGDYILTATQSIETHGVEGAFVAFDLFFQVTEETPVYLTSNSSVSATNTSTGIENAARVAFIDEGTSAVGDGSAASQALTGATSDDVVIWEPNIDVHTPSAVENAKSNYGILDLTTTNADQLNYNGVKAAIPASAAIGLDSTDANYFAAVTPKIATTAAGISASAYESAFTLKAGVTKVRIYMWIEGQDVDCENNASGGALSFNLQFSSNTKAS